MNKIRFKVIGDERGSLISLENRKDIPFEVKRVYYIFDTKENVRRGYHAHKNLEQLVVCVKGSCDFIIDDGTEKKTIKLSDPAEGIHIKGVVWREMDKFSNDCVLMVLANDYYNENDYIRDYEEFTTYIKERL